MNWTDDFYSLAGGVIIGLSVTLMLLFNGRVAGISGILASALGVPTRDGFWRWAFVIGLVTGGLIIQVLQPSLFTSTSTTSFGVVIMAGLLVGYGTTMGSGCTSGHGVCGVSRLSLRSITATLIFILFGVLAVQSVRILSGGSI